jgi:hypothetical protein
MPTPVQFNAIDDPDALGVAVGDKDADSERVGHRVFSAWRSKARLAALMNEAGDQEARNGCGGIDGQLSMVLGGLPGDGVAVAHLVAHA